MAMVIKKSGSASGPKVVKKPAKVDMEAGIEAVEVKQKAEVPPAPEEAKSEFKSIKSQVVIKHADGSESSKEEVVGGEMFNEPPANVAINIGLTRNLGNYESIKFSVSLSVPTLNKEADIEQAFSFAKEWVDSKVNQINSEVDSMVH